MTTSWKFYVGTKEAWDAMLFECMEAKKYILFEQFIFQDDEIGRSFIEVFEKKVKEGVTVEIICDAFGSKNFIKSNLFKKARESGINITVLNPFLGFSIKKIGLYFFRDHRKIGIIDGRIGFIGGVCIDYTMHDWQDTHLKIEGDEVVEAMEKSFRIMQDRANRKPGGRETKDESLISPEFSYITNAPLFRKRFLYKKLIKLIKQSNQKIYLTTPYFVPDRRFVRAIKNASKRGVEVIILIPKDSRIKVLNIVTRSFFKDLLKAGVSIYLYEKMIHTKTFIIDKWASVGSMNFDELSFRYNFEANLLSQNDDFRKELESYFFRDLSNAHKVETESWKRRSFTEKLLEFILKPIGKVL